MAVASNVLGITYPGAGATLYCVVRKASSGTVWNGSSMEAWADGSVGNYDLPLTDGGGDYYYFTVPSGLAAGDFYHFTYYVQAGATPAITDAALPASETLYWDGSSATSFGSGSYLTTLATVKLYAGETTTDNDTKYTNALAAATAMIQKWCDQQFIVGTFTEYKTPHTLAGSNGIGMIELDNRPITAITRIATTLNSVITASHDTAPVATVSVSSTNVTLSSTTSGTTTTSALAFATYPTMTLLAAAIDATSGWTATADTTYVGMSSSLLKPLQLASAGTLDGPCDLLAHTRELWCMNLNAERGVIYGNFPAGLQAVEVRYTAGEATIPDDVQQAAAALSTSLYRISNTDRSLKSEKIGAYSYEVGNWSSAGGMSAMLPNISPDAAMLLQPYRRIALA